jgi:hypothetical protein
MRISKTAVIGVLVLVTAICVIVVSVETRRPTLQATIYAPNFPELAKACPEQAFLLNLSHQSVDYLVVDLRWADGWHVDALRNEDSAVLWDRNEPPDGDKARLARQICGVIRRDFPLWLNTQRQRASIEKK